MAVVENTIIGKPFANLGIELFLERNILLGGRGDDLIIIADWNTVMTDNIAACYART